jgi:hypothetical protein
MSLGLHPRANAAAVHWMDGTELMGVSYGRKTKPPSQCPMPILGLYTFRALLGYIELTIFRAARRRFMFIHANVQCANRFTDRRVDDHKQQEMGGVVDASK